jgi:enoyl-CoA hydratase/carnithine racemase
MATMRGRIHVERNDQIGWIVFDHPDHRNAISLQMWREIPGAVAQLAADDDVSVVVMRGAGEVAFVSGADISEFERNRIGDAAEIYDAETGRAIGALADLEKPLIAMIHGFCVGGGTAIALTADLRYAADDAAFAIPTARLGLGYHMAALEALTNVVGFAAAKEIFFTARLFSANEALRMGLVNNVVPKSDLEGLVHRTAERIGQNAPLALRSLKLTVRELAREPATRDIGAVEASIRACSESEDCREGTRAFLEKRRPDFQGR